MQNGAIDTYAFLSDDFLPPKGLEFKQSLAWGTLFVGTEIVVGDITFAAVDGSPVPVPAALPLFATGLGALGFLAYRRQRKGLA